MKKLLIPTLLVLTIVFSACTASSTSTPRISAEGTLPIETQLAVGTLKLAGTDQDISLEQAEELLVFWQVYKELSQSDTAAQAEVDGLIEQIEETMSDDQLQAIMNMNLTQQDVFTSMQGVSVVSSDASDSAVSIPSGSAGMPAGGPPDNGGGAPPEGGMPPDMGGGVPASQSAGSGFTVSTGVPSALVQAVIESLQKKIAA